MSKSVTTAIDPETTTHSRVSFLSAGSFQDEALKGCSAPVPHSESSVIPPWTWSSKSWTSKTLQQFSKILLPTRFFLLRLQFVQEFVDWHFASPKRENKVETYEHT